MPEMDHRQDNSSRTWQQMDARILGQILAAQNVVFALPDALRIAEFYAQVLMNIPGITACRVCLGGESVTAGEMENDICKKCKVFEHLTRENGTPSPARVDFRCPLADQPGMRDIAIAADRHHFGFFVIRSEQVAQLGRYQPFIDNLSSYIALILENRWQKAMLHKANSELELKVEERTQELTTANAELSAYRERLEELVQERTNELETKNAQLERMNKLFVGRELRMVELKKRIIELESQLDKSSASAADNKDEGA